MVVAAGSSPPPAATGGALVSDCARPANAASSGFQPTPPLGGSGPPRELTPTEALRRLDELAGYGVLRRGRWGYTLTSYGRELVKQAKRPARS